MGTISDELATKIKSLSDSEKIELVDSILILLDKPDPEIKEDRSEAKNSTAFATSSGVARRPSGVDLLIASCTCRGACGV